MHWEKVLNFIAGLHLCQCFHLVRMICLIKWAILMDRGWGKCRPGSTRHWRLLLLYFLAVDFYLARSQSILWVSGYETINDLGHRGCCDPKIVWRSIMLVYIIISLYDWLIGVKRAPQTINDLGHRGCCDPKIVWRSIMLVYIIISLYDWLIGVKRAPQNIILPKISLICMCRSKGEDRERKIGIKI